MARTRLTTDGPSGNAADRETPTVGEAEAPPPRFAHESEEEFAKILDFYGITWRYEPRTFPLRVADGKLVEAFTPDFYLPDIDTYIELTTLKPDLMTDKNRKVRLLREFFPDVKIKLLRKRDYLQLLVKYGFGPPSSKRIEGVHRVLVSTPQPPRRASGLGGPISQGKRG